jgi:hypothetical protein
LSSTQLINAAAILSKKTTEVFDKEDDVSRQVGKPIYVENQSNDSQTQCTEQTMKIFAAVRAKLQTISALVKDKYSFSETTPLHNSENYNTNFKKIN